jgi:stage II sporulation protein AA (anti-sigma F factor antagonist)
MSKAYRIDKLRLGEEVAVLRLHGRFQLESASELRVIHDWLRRKGYHHVVVNMADVEFFGSSAAGALIIISEELSMSYGSLQVCELSDAAWRVVEALNLQNLLKIRGSERDALENFISI